MYIYYQQFHWKIKIFIAMSHLSSLMPALGRKLKLMLKNEPYYLPSIPSKYPDMALPCAIEPQSNEFFL